MNNLRLYETPAENIFEERRKQIESVESVAKEVLKATGFDLVKNGKYETLDPSMRTFYQIIKAESIKPEENGKKRKAEIKLPIMDNGAYIINGNRYVPVFQISDVPIFKRSGEFLTLRNTFCTLVLNTEITALRVGKSEWPLLLLLLRVAKDEFFDETCFKAHTADISENTEDTVTLRLSINTDLILTREKFGNAIDPILENPEIIEMFNQLQSKYETEEEGIEHVLRNWNDKAKIDKILEVIDMTDFIMVPNGVFDKPFSMTELLTYVFKLRDTYKQWEIREINDVSKRRVRLCEWICYKLSQQYKTNGSKKSKAVYADSLLNVVNLDSRRVLDDTVNPLGELCIQSRVIFDGMGGIAKDACSVTVRNLHESYRGVIDPIDTPTGAAVGICQHMVPDSTIKNGSLIASDSGNMLSVASELVPLLQHDDGTRIEMACNQQRQAICLAEPEIPLVKSGYEHMYTEYSSSLRIAKDNGQVIFKDDSLMVIKYNNGEGEVIDLSPESFTDFDKTLHTSLDIKDKFEKGDTLAHTKNINANTHELMLGSNLMVGFMSFDSWNFDDAIAISESAAHKLRYLSTYKDSLELGENSLFSITDTGVYKPMPEYGSYVNKGDVLFRISDIDSSSIESMFPIYKEITAPISGIFKYTYYIKNPSSPNFQFQRFNKATRDQQAAREEQLKEIFSYIPNDQKNIERYCYIGSAKRIHDNTGVIDWSIQGEEDIAKGCKLSNRHGHKGVISIVVPDEEMPKLPDGRHLDLLLNPLGVITRMNPGQLFEIHLTWLMDQWLHKNVDLENKEFAKEVIKFISIIDNTKNKSYTNEAKKYIRKNPEVLYEIRSQGLQIIQPPFESCTIKQLEKLRKYVGVDYETDVQYNGSTYKCSVGWMYMMRLYHEPSHKIFGRSVGAYGAHSQPPSGSNSHRLGEMEVWALLAYGATDTLKEFLSIKSDNPSERERLLKYLYDDNVDLYQPLSLDTITKETFQTYLKGAGLSVEF